MTGACSPRYWAGYGPPTPDPVTVLGAFLGLDHFDIRMERAMLEVPADLRFGRQGH